MARAYEQHCALAHALDHVGERWTLLIVRELMAGPRRYTDLAEGLVTVPTNVLATRLKEMEERDLVARRRLPAPADSVVVYELTESGESLGAGVVELARWGMRTLPPAREHRSFRTHWLILALRARFDASAVGPGIRESYEFRLDGEPVHFEVADGDGVARMGPAADPAVVIDADTDTLLELTSGAITPEDATRRGARIEGEPAAIERMAAVLPARRLEAAA